MYGKVNKQNEGPSKLMYEIFILQSVIDTAIEKAYKKHAKKIESITLKVGQLKFLDKEKLKDTFKRLTEKTIAKDAELKIETIPARFKCMDCNMEWELKNKKITQKEINLIRLSTEYIKKIIKCPKCKSNRYKILKGNEIYIKDIEIHA